MRPLTATTLSISLMTPVTAQASTLISIGATGSSWTNAPVTGLQNWSAKHNFADDPVTATKVVGYPASLGFIGVPMGDSVLQGAAELREAIESISGLKIVVCESQGCMSVTNLLMQFGVDPRTAPASEDLIFVMIGNPATAGTGTSAQNPGEYEAFLRITFPGATPETQFETVNVTREYDFFADRPDGDPSVLAVLNNLVAFLVVHPFYGDVDMNDPDNLIKVVGNTTYVLVPTKQLPMLQSLYDAARAWQLLTGQTNLLEDVEGLDARLRAIIDDDYDRTGYAPLGPSTQAEPEDPTVDAAEPTTPSIEDQPQDVPAESGESLEPEEETPTTDDPEVEQSADGDLAEDGYEAESEDEDVAAELSPDEDLADTDDLTEAEDLAEDDETPRPEDSEATGASTPSTSPTDPDPGPESTDTGSGTPPTSI